MSQTAWLILLAVYVIVVDHSYRGEIPVLVGSVGHLHLITLWCQVAVTSLNHLTVVTKLENKSNIEITRSHVALMAFNIYVQYMLWSPCLIILPFLFIIRPFPSNIFQIMSKCSPRSPAWLASASRPPGSWSCSLPAHSGVGPLGAWSKTLCPLNCLRCEVLPGVGRGNSKKKGKGKLLAVLRGGGLSVSIHSIFCIISSSWWQWTGNMTVPMLLTPTWQQGFR